MRNNTQGKISRNVKTQSGFERVQLLWVLGVAAIFLVILVPTYTKKYYGEREARLKVLLRAFHTANQAYNHRNPQIGFAASIEQLARSADQVRYLDSKWLDGRMEGFGVHYQAPQDEPRQFFSLSAVRTSPRHAAYCIDHKGVIRADKEGDPLQAHTTGCQGGIEVV